MEFTVEELVMEMLKRIGKGTEFLPPLSKLYIEVVFHHLPGPLEGAKELLRKACELAELKKFIKVNGRATSLARSIKDKIRDGELEEAERLIKELEETI